MKQTRLTKILATGALCAVAVSMALAQTTTTTTTTDPVTGTTTTQQATTSAAGTIVTYTPDSDYLMFRTAPDAAPVRYYYTNDTANSARGDSGTRYSSRSGQFHLAGFSRKFAAGWLHRKGRSRICKRKCTKCRTSLVCT